MNLYSFTQNIAMLPLILVVSKNLPHFVKVSRLSIKIWNIYENMPLCSKHRVVAPCLNCLEKLTPLCDGFKAIHQELIKILMKMCSSVWKYAILFKT